MSLLNKHRLPFCGPNWNQRSQGFTLVELVVVMGVLAILTLMGTGAYSHFINRAKNTRAIAEIRLLEKEILEFWQTNDRLPDSLAELDHAVILDPWKTPYQYINFDTTAGWEDMRRVTKKKDNGKGKGKGQSAALNEDFDLFSMGEDRMSAPDLDDGSSLDDIVRAGDGRYTGLASEYKS
jgi:prepilin-type N-terminal cleavage/methylation domain-containing protein